MYKNNKKIVLIFLFVLLDYLAIVAAEQSAVFLRNFFFNATSLHISWLNFWVIFPVLYMVFFNMRQLYSRRMPFYKEVEQIFHSCLYGTVALVFVLYVAQIAARTSRLFVLLFAVLVFLFIAVLRYATKKYLIKKQLLQIPVLIIGAGKTAELLALRLKNNLARPFNRMLKTVFDYTLTIIGTIAISPILVFIAVWIYKDSPGPVIFKHIRIGKDGKPFPCYKFRSMCVDAKEKLAELLANDPAAREEWERDFKLKNDPRITKSGAFLRKTSLDELPQIFNVLKGEMSLVGPRPIIQEELERYGEYVGDYLMVKPGITGMWQVSGRSDIEYRERVLLDSWYVRNWSVWIDIVILFKTFKVVLLRKGAY